MALLLYINTSLFYYVLKMFCFVFICCVSLHGDYYLMYCSINSKCTAA